MKHAGDILVIDDYSPTVEFIAEALMDDGYTVRTASDAAHAQAAIAERRPDLVLVDLHLPGTPGDVLARDLQNDGLTGVPVILMTADVRSAGALSMDGISFCLTKPFGLDDLLACITAHIRPMGSTPVGR
jgi:DNA-binding response OmpR family regulator